MKQAARIKEAGEKTSRRGLLASARKSQSGTPHLPKTTKDIKYQTPGALERKMHNTKDDDATGRERPLLTEWGFWPISGPGGCPDYRGSPQRGRGKEE